MTDRIGEKVNVTKVGSDGGNDETTSRAIGQWENNRTKEGSYRSYFKETGGEGNRGRTIGRSFGERREEEEERHRGR